MRFCPECGAEVAPIIDIGGTDHYVVIDGKLDLRAVDSDDPSVIAFVAEQDVTLSTCSAVMAAAKLRAADLLERLTDELDG